MGDSVIAGFNGISNLLLRDLATIGIPFQVCCVLGGQRESKKHRPGMAEISASARVVSGATLRPKLATRKRAVDYVRVAVSDPGISHDRESLSPRPYSQWQRVGYSLFWICCTALLVVAGVVSMIMDDGSIVGGLFAFLLSGLAANYVWKILTWRAKHLWFFFIV